MYPTQAHLPETGSLIEQFGQSGLAGGGPVFSRARNIPRNIRNIPSRSHIPSSNNNNAIMRNNTMARVTANARTVNHRIIVPARRQSAQFLDYNFRREQQGILDRAIQRQFTNINTLPMQTQMTRGTITLISDLNRINSTYIRHGDHEAARSEAINLVLLYILENDSLRLLSNLSRNQFQRESMDYGCSEHNSNLFILRLMKTVAGLTNQYPIYASWPLKANSKNCKKLY